MTREYQSPLRLVVTMRLRDGRVHSYLFRTLAEAERDAKTNGATIIEHRERGKPRMEAKP